MTREPIETRICSLFAGGREHEAYSISAIARAIAAAYPHVHAAVKSMIGDGTLTTICAGRSVLCTVNLADEGARALLWQAHIIEKRKRLSAPNLRNLDADIQRLAAEEPRLLVAAIVGNETILVLSDNNAWKDVARRVSVPHLTFLTPSRLRRELLDGFSLDGCTVLYGYERLLLLLQPIKEHLLIDRVFRAAPGKRKAPKAVRHSRKPVSRRPAPRRLDA